MRTAQNNLEIVYPWPEKPGIFAFYGTFGHSACHAAFLPAIIRISGVDVTGRNGKEVAGSNLFRFLQSTITLSHAINLLYQGFGYEVFLCAPGPVSG